MDDNIKRWEGLLNIKKELTMEKKHDLILLKMIITKIKEKVGVSSNRALSQHMGYGVNYITDLLNGRANGGTKFMSLLLYHGGLTKDDFKQEIEHKEMDEYINSKGHLIIEGVDFGKVV